MKMNHKNILQSLLFICSICIVSSSFAAEPSQPSVTVEFENEIESLAKGFAEAFTLLPIGAKYIIIRTDQGPTPLHGSVKTITALGGVLHIQMDRGLVHILSARDIIRITSEKPKSAKK
ncbi:MAG: hypothetical protein JKY51_09965 [Opitutaceae bacterium]|nr:hypothetical protein [Opitutaceae bacterium]